MKSYRQLAEQQYESVRRAVNSFAGNNAPAWVELSPVEKAAWVESVRQLVAEVQAIH